VWKALKVHHRYIIMIDPRVDGMPIRILDVRNGWVRYSELPRYPDLRTTINDFLDNHKQVQCDKSAD